MRPGAAGSRSRRQDLDRVVGRQGDNAAAQLASLGLETLAGHPAASPALVAVGNSYAPFSATSFWKRGLLRSGSKLGSMRIHAAETQPGFLSRSSSWLSAASCSPVDR